MTYKELGNFAQWFHQDFDMVHESIDIGSDEYLKSLTKERKTVLFEEIRQLLNEHPGKDNKALKNAWLKLGAQWWSKVESPQINKTSTN